MTTSYVLMYHCICKYERIYILLLDLCYCFPSFLSRQKLCQVGAKEDQLRKNTIQNTCVKTLLNFAWTQQYFCNERKTHATGLMARIALNSILRALRLCSHAMMKWFFNIQWFQHQQPIDRTNDRPSVC